MSAKRPADYDPNQDPLKRQKLRRKLREINEDIDINGVDGVRLSTLTDLEVAFDEVKNPRDAVLDAMALSGVAKSFAKKMIGNNTGKTPWDSLATVKEKVYSALAANANGERTDTREAWNGIGKIAQKYLKIAPTPHFMLGPLSMDTTKKQRVVGQRRQKADFSNAVKASSEVDPEMEKKQDFSEGLVRDLTEIIIEKGKTSTPYYGLFDLCVHPMSFAQTVENFFHLSFIVKRGYAQIAYENDEPCVYSTSAPDGQEKIENPEQHLMIELTMQDWEDAIQMYNIREPTIPDRPRDV